MTLRPGLGLMLVNFGYVAVLSFGAAAATEQGTGIARLVIPVFALGVIASRTVLAAVPDRLGAPRTLSIAVLLESAGLAGLAAASSTPLALAALVVMAVGQGLAVPSLGLIALASVPPSRHGRTAGAFFAYFDAGVGTGGRRWASRRASRTQPVRCSRRRPPCWRPRRSLCSSVHARARARR